MGSRVVANGGKVHYGVNTYICDSVEDLEALTSCSPGSKAFVFETNGSYIKNNKFQWILRSVVGGGGSGSGDGFIYEALTDEEILDILK